MDVIWYGYEIYILIKMISQNFMIGKFRKYSFPNFRSSETISFMIT